MKGADKQKKPQKKTAQKTLKEKRAEKRAAKSAAKLHVLDLEPSPSWRYLPRGRDAV